jgi:hypothetical protein
MAHDAAPLKSWLEEYARKALPSQLPGCKVVIEREAV